MGFTNIAALKEISYKIFSPHDRTEAQSVPVYGSGNTEFRPPGSVALQDPPNTDGFRFARIVIRGGGDLLMETGDDNSVPEEVDLASTQLSSSATEHLIPLLFQNPVIKLAGLEDTVTFQLSWVK